jgi:hypothetical protein
MSPGHFDVCKTRDKRGNKMLNKRAGLFGIAVVLLVLALALVAAACGGGDQTTTTAAPETTAPPTTLAATPTTAASAFEGDAAFVAANWEAFMNPATPLAERVALLENGAKHQAELETLAASPAAAAASVKVTDVKFNSDDEAKVTFDILAAGVPVMVGETGTAVVENGEWKVSEKSFAGMLAALTGASGGGTGTPTTK